MVKLTRFNPWDSGIVFTFFFISIYMFSIWNKIICLYLICLYFHFSYPYIFPFKIYSVKSFDFPALSPSDEQGSNRKVTLNPIPCSNNQREVAEIFQRILFQRISAIFARRRRRFVKTANSKHGQYRWQQMKLIFIYIIFSIFFSF